MLFPVADTFQYLLSFGILRSALGHEASDHLAALVHVEFLSEIQIVKSSLLAFHCGFKGLCVLHQCLFENTTGENARKLSKIDCVLVTKWPNFLLDGFLSLLMVEYDFLCDKEVEDRLHRELISDTLRVLIVLPGESQPHVFDCL